MHRQIPIHAYLRPLAFRWLMGLLVVFLALPRVAVGQNDFEEFTPESEVALERGLQWLAKNQGKEGNWGSNDLGLVSMGTLAFLSAGHTPGRGKYGDVVQKSLDFVASHARPSGLLNMSDQQRDMYNHGLATFVLGQAHGMNTNRERRTNKVLDSTQCEDGGWDYKAKRQKNGHDLSLVVMQAKALRSAVDSGLEVPPEVIELAIRCVREHYTPKSGGRSSPESEQQKVPGQFTYGKGGGGGSIAMAACGVVCLQEFGLYDDWRIPKNMEVINAAVKTVTTDAKDNKFKVPRHDGTMPFDSYTLYYVGQALYQVNGEHWKECYPLMRDYLVASQLNDKASAQYGSWHDHGAGGGGRVGGKEGDLYATSVSCFILSIPNRYLPILQEGKIESLKQKKE
jgi:hypothetical protein